MDCNFKKLCDLWNQQLQIWLVAEFHEKSKKPKNGSENDLFRYFWTKLLKDCFHICNLHYQICLSEKFPKKNPKKSEFRTKNDLFWHFWARILKHYCHIWNKQPQICLPKTSCEKSKVPKLRSKNVLPSYFSARNLQHKLSYLKSARSNLLNFKFLQKIKMRQNGTENAGFLFFWTIILKHYCHVWNQHCQIGLTEKFDHKTKKPEFWTKNALF